MFFFCYKNSFCLFSALPYIFFRPFAWRWWWKNIHFVVPSLFKILLNCLFVYEFHFLNKNKVFLVIARIARKVVRFFSCGCDKWIHFMVITIMLRSNTTSKRFLLKTTHLVFCLFIANKIIQHNILRMFFIFNWKHFISDERFDWNKKKPMAHWENGL